jgi:hypothetical protein
LRRLLFESRQVEWVRSAAELHDHPLETVHA